MLVECQRLDIIELSTSFLTLFLFFDGLVVSIGLGCIYIDKLTGKCECLICTSLYIIYAWYQHSFIWKVVVHSLILHRPKRLNKLRTGRSVHLFRKRKTAPNRFLLCVSIQPYIYSPMGWLNNAVMAMVMGETLTQLLGQRLL